MATCGFSDNNFNWLRQMPDNKLQSCRENVETKNKNILKLKKKKKTKKKKKPQCIQYEKIKERFVCFLKLIFQFNPRIFY